MKGLEGKVAVVTGAGGAIGRAIAMRLAELGSIVGVFDVNEENAEATAKAIADAGGKAAAAAVDITDYAAVVKGVEAIEDKLGPIDVLVNCAGWDKLCFFLKSEPPLWDRLIDINYRGALNMHHAVLKGMAKRGGRVVNIASDAGRVGSAGEAVYAGCKAALIAFSKSMAREMTRSNVTVNVVCPGPTDTPLFNSFREEGELGDKIIEGLKKAIPMRRLGAPEDIAGIVAFLASDEASYITGQVISVSGGLTMAG
jgi:2-hydroxycyclohexanecarboxyl-CoA dehydrogenase